MKISIIIPSFLGPYRHAADDRKNKLCRAINSVMLQDYKETECIVVADGCRETAEIVKEYFPTVKLLEIEKQPLFSGNVRNAGIEASEGEWICYLDADDMIDTTHLSTIARNVTGDWVYFNDFTLNKGQFVERECQLKLGFCGTSNIAHRRSVQSRWRKENKYGYDDWNFIQELKKESQTV